MGLDQYLYAAEESNTYEEDQIELGYRRKHPNLHGWMENLWKDKDLPVYTYKDDFNGIELELTKEDIDKLEQDILNNQLPYTEGFFFGKPSDEYYKEADLEFIKKAREKLTEGFKIFYNSSW